THVRLATSLLAPQRLLGFARPPRHRADSAECDACVANRLAVELERDRGGGERERVRRTVANLDVHRTRGERRGRNVHGRDQLSARECRLAFGPVAGQDIELRDWNRTLSFWTAHAHDGVERGEWNRHVGRMRRDAMLAAAEDRVNTIESVECRASRTRLAFVAWARGIAEVIAARPLKQVAAGRRHVAQLARRAGEECLRQHRESLADERMVREIAVADERAD